MAKIRRKNIRNILLIALCLILGAFLSGFGAVSAFMTDHEQAVLAEKIRTGKWNYQLSVDAGKSLKSLKGTWNGKQGVTLYDNQESGTIIDIPAPTLTGYTFSGWTFNGTSAASDPMEGNSGVFTYDASTKTGTYVTGRTPDGKSTKDGDTDTFHDDLLALWTPNNYTVTYEDWFVDASNNRKVKLGSTTKQKPMDSTVNGSEIGTDAEKGTYYKNYVYKSSTSAFVTASGTTVYRYFWLWTDLNIYNPERTLQHGGTVSFSVNGTDYRDVTNEPHETDFNTTNPYGTTYYIKNIRPKNEWEELDLVEKWEGTDPVVAGRLTPSDGVYTCTPTGITSICIYMKYRTYTITSCNLADGTVSTQDYTYVSDTVHLSATSKDGYSFAGWTGSGIDGISDTATVPSGSYGNKTFTANFYSERDGAFAYWSTTPDPGSSLSVKYKDKSSYTDNDTATADGGTTAKLYAEWFVYVPQGGTLASVSVDDSFRVTPGTPALSGYSFAGWMKMGDSSLHDSLTVDVSALKATGDENGAYVAIWRKTA